MKSVPKGRILIIGGHEEKGIKGDNIIILKREKIERQYKILTELITKIPHRDHVIEIIAAASEIPKKMEKMYVKAFKNAGFSEVQILVLDNKKQVQDPKILKRINTAHSIFFTGGDQKKLASLLNGTKLLRTLKRKYRRDEDFIIAGTSAGAMALPALMITGASVETALLKGNMDIAKGLGFIKGVIVDTHFIKRGRFARLAHAVALNPNYIGIGLSEDTGLIISEGNKMECKGSGMVIIIDGTGIKATNISYVDKHTPIVAENIKIHIMAAGSKYLLREKKFIMRKNLKVVSQTASKR